MPRRPRIHVPGGLYYIVERTSPGRTLFEHPQDARRLEALLASALERMSAHALAYCWMPHALHLVIQIETTPVGRVLQGALSHYARHVHERSGDCGHLFVGHYSALLIQPDAWLAPLIRYLHFAPVLASLTQAPEQYEHTSHLVYLGRRRIPWVETRRALALAALTDDRTAYERLMHERPTRADLQAFTPPFVSTVLGSDAFKATLPRSVREHRSTLSLEQIIAQISRLLQVSPADLTSRSRARHLAFARSLIAWHATERNVATLTQVARRLRRDPATLSIGMRRHRAASPQWFRLDALRHLKPLGGSQQ